MPGANPQENHNKLTEELRSLQGRIEALIKESDTNNIPKEKCASALQEITIDFVRVLVSHQRDPREVKFCQSLDHVCQIKKVTSDRIRVDKRLKPIKKQVEELENKRTRLENALKNFQ